MYEVERKLPLNNGKEITFYTNLEHASRCGNYGMASVDGQNCYYGLGTCQDDDTGLGYSSGIPAFKSGKQYYILTEVPDITLFNLNRYLERTHYTKTNENGTGWYDLYGFDGWLPKPYYDELYGIHAMPDASYAFNDTDQGFYDRDNMIYLKGIQQDLLDSWDMSKVTNMEHFFSGDDYEYDFDHGGFHCDGMTKIDLSKWNVRKVENTSYMFAYFNECCDIDMHGWGTENLKTMRGMFAHKTGTEEDCFGYNETEFEDYWIRDEVIAADPIHVDINMTGWNTPNLEDMSYLFSGCLYWDNETFKCLEAIDTSHVKDMSYMFSRCQKLTVVPHIDMSSVVNAEGMFFGCINSIDMSNITNTGNVKSWRSAFKYANVDTDAVLTLTNISSSTDTSYMFSETDLETFPTVDTSNVKTMDGMFYKCSELKEVGLLNTFNVTSMKEMFYECSSLTTIPQFNISKVEDTSYMFYYCENLNNIPFLDMGNVEDASYMFYNCGSLTDLPSGMNFSNLVDMSYMFSGTAISSKPENTYVLNVEKINGIFYRCNNLANIDFSDWETSNIEDMNYMLARCSSLTSVTGLNTQSALYMDSTFYYCSSLFEVSELDTNKVIHMPNIFSNCTSLPSVFPWAIDCSNIINDLSLKDMFKGSSVTEVTLKNVPETILPYINYKLLNSNKSNMVINIESTIEAPRIIYINDIVINNVYSRCIRYIYNHTYETITEIPDTLDFSDITSMNGTFQDCIALKRIPTLDLSNVISLELLFGNCIELEEIPELNLQNAVYASKMFYNCKKLKNINIINSTNLSNTEYMFYGCESLTDIPQLDTSNVELMSYMFQGCKNITLDKISNLNTHNVTNMSYMFSDCTSITSVDFSKFDFSNVNEINYIFANCTGLISISNMNLNNISYVTHIFSGCTNMSKIDGEVNISNCPQIEALFEDVPITTIPKIKITGAVKIASLFKNCNNLIVADMNNVEINFSEGDYVYPTLNNLFDNCQNLTTILNLNNISGIKYTEGLFKGCKSLTSLSQLDLNMVRSINNMFNGCESLTEIDMSIFNLTNVEGMSYTFANCKNLRSINNLDISSLQNATGMFSGCTNLETFPDFSNNADLRSVKEMFKGCTKLTELPEITFNNSISEITEMFRGCIGLTSIDLSKLNFKTIYYTSMRIFADCTGLRSITGSFSCNDIAADYLFESCSSLTDIDNTFDFTKLKNFNGIFKDCTSLTTIHNFTDNLSSTKSAREMFKGCTSLTNLPEIDFTKIYDVTSMFEGCTSLPEEFPYTLDFSGYYSYGYIQNIFKNSSVKKVKIKNNITNTYVKNYITSSYLKGNNTLTIQWVD